MKPTRLQRWLAAALILTLTVPAPARAIATAPRSTDAADPLPRLTLLAGSTTAQEVRADTFNLPLAADDVSAQYEKPSVRLEISQRLQFTLSVAEAGAYVVSFDMAAAESFMNTPEAELQVDGAYPVADARRIVFPVFYANSSDDFPLDRYGNEALTRQVQRIVWTTVPMRDAGLSRKYPVRLDLSAGEHTFDFGVTQGSLYLGSIYIAPAEPFPSYAAYLQAHPSTDAANVLIELEAEHTAFKDDTSIRPTASRSLAVTPYDTYRLMLNTLGGEGWKASGSTAYYEIEVPADGYYELTLRALQDTKSNFTVFRRITVNGEVPFDELSAVPFKYSTAWGNITLGGDTPYKIFLHKGTNVIGVGATDSPYADAADRLQQVLLDINELSLEVKKLTGNQIDPFKEWEISEYIPNLKARLTTIADELRADKAALVAVNGVEGSQEVLTYQMVIDSLDFLAQDPDKLPNRMNRFSEGSSSAAQLLGKVLPTLQSQPLQLDKLYVHSPDQTPPSADAPLLMQWSEDLKRFVYSFQPNPYQTIGAEEGELEVWVNRPRQYVDLLQLMADQQFTPETGIKVKFSIMPDEGKLVLANAAGIQPDVALGVSTNIPYELAVRNALKDLRSFDDFDSYIHVYSPGALLSYIINDSVYAIPETQDFWVTYYRKDILDSLGIPVPHTWNEVVEILPELQRYGMNFNTPLSSGAGGKVYLMTAPYIFNQGARLYSDDGFATGLESEEAIDGIKFMAESFTLYGMPLTTSSFYESFRYGSLPLGVSNIETYIKLVTAAPEIEGLWGIDLYPATIARDGKEYRYATGSAQASIMFANTEQPENAWTFMKWWMSTETQVDFQQQLEMNYGREYLWNSANLEAFRLSSFPPEHKEVILRQWEWLQEPVKLPGSYMQEREISNAWNKIVFDGVNPRVAIDSSIILINREITRKMEEFGYLKDGVKVREFKIPTIDTVKGWMNGDGN